MGLYTNGSGYLRVCWDAYVDEIIDSGSTPGFEYTE